MLYLGWTTVATLVDAERLYGLLVEQDLAVCVQTEGPLTSVYRWQGKVERSVEYRLTVKFLPENQAALERVLFAHHPYEVPEWVAVPAGIVGEKYLSWARGGLQSDRF